MKCEIERMEINYTFYFFAFFEKVIKKLLTFCYWQNCKIDFAFLWCQTCGATDGNVNSMRSLANWVQAGMLIGDYAKAAEWTVVSGATSDPQTREELVRVVANYSFA